MKHALLFLLAVSLNAATPDDPATKDDLVFCTAILAIFIGLCMALLARDIGKIRDKLPVFLLVLCGSANAATITLTDINAPAPQAASYTSFTAAGTAFLNLTPEGWYYLRLDDAPLRTFTFTFEQSLQSISLVVDNRPENPGSGVILSLDGVPVYYTGFWVSFAHRITIEADQPFTTLQASTAASSIQYEHALVYGASGVVAIPEPGGFALGILGGFLLMTAALKCRGGR